VKLHLKPKVFSAFIELIYEGFVLISPEDEEEFKEALKVLGQVLSISLLS